VKLSEHFALWELTKSQVADRNNIKNLPDEESTQNLGSTCEEILEPVRRHYGKPIAPSSGYRCLELNRVLGSSDRSQHTTGQAVDFEVPGVANMDLARWIMDNVDYDQLILEFYKEGQPNSGWVHCSYVGQANRKQARRFDGRSWEPLS
jgi:hypothetical protein|tara:strand:- start:3294 stop:3740 length:447 start_codon:yes stop_codon:yes gene_type:complete